MLYSKTSPYIRRFDSILRRLFEAGLINYWKQKYLRVYAFVRKNNFKIKILKLCNSNFCKMDYFVDNVVLSHNEIIIFFLMGYSVAFMIFICELITARIQRQFKVELMIF